MPAEIVIWAYDKGLIYQASDRLRARRKIDLLSPPPIHSVQPVSRNAHLETL